jgi:hypothetical protein
MKKLIGGATFLAGLAVLVNAATAQATPGEAMTSTMSSEKDSR